MLGSTQNRSKRSTARPASDLVVHPPHKPRYRAEEGSHTPEVRYNFDDFNRCAQQRWLLATTCHPGHWEETDARTGAAREGAQDTDLGSDSQPPVLS